MCDRNYSIFLILMLHTQAAPMTDLVQTVGKSAFAKMEHSVMMCQENAFVQLDGLVPIAPSPVLPAGTEQNTSETY